MHIFHNGIGKPVGGLEEQDEDFSPTNISGVVLWLDAADEATITHTGGSISQWSDKSGNAYDLTQSTPGFQPVTGSRTLNSLNVLDFNADYLENTADVSNIFTSEATWFVISEVDDSNINNLLYVNDSASVNGGFAYNGGGALNILEVEIKRDSAKNNVFFYADNSSSPAPATNSLTDSAQIGYAQYESGIDILAGNNSGEQDTGDPAPASATYTPARFRVGAHGTNTDRIERWLNGAIGEVLIYSRVLTNSEINRIGQYLEDKWGLTWTDV